MNFFKKKTIALNLKHNLPRFGLKNSTPNYLLTSQIAQTKQLKTLIAQLKAPNKFQIILKEKKCNVNIKNRYYGNTKIRNLRAKSEGIIPKSLYVERR